MQPITEVYHPSERISPELVNGYRPEYAYRGKSTRIKGRIDVPTGFFKVVLSLRRNHAKAIGFYYSNSTQKQPISTTAKTVDEIERLTGIDFFSSLPDSIENVVESKYSLNDWR